MQSQTSRWFVRACLASLLLLVVCDTASAFRLFFWRRPAPQGPPAHAPAHGHRRRHVHGYELIFDAGLGVYVAVGHTDVYYHEGRFYRCHGGVWQVSLRADVWQPAGIDRLPPGLQVNGNSLVKLNGNGKDGNSGGNDNQSQAHSGVNASRLSDKPDGNPGKPDTGENKAGANSPGNDDKAAQAHTNGYSNRLNSHGPARPDARANASPRSNRPAGGGKATSGPKGKRK